MAFLAQGAARLNTGVIELGRLPDNDRTGTDNHNRTPEHDSLDWAGRRRFPARLLAASGDQGVLEWKELGALD